MKPQPKAARIILQIRCIGRAPATSGVISLDASQALPQPLFRQGPWNVDLRTPPGPEGSNGSLLDICRGNPGTFSIYHFRFTIDDLKLLLDERNLSRNLSLNINRKWRIKS